jgi:hypothetical protein
MTLSGIDSLPNKAILDPYGKYLTFINTFTVEPDRAEALIEALKHSTEETFRSKKGFISVNLHPWQFPSILSITICAML